jgi:hypothetical protein
MKKLLTILLVLMPLVTRSQTWPSSLIGKWSLKNPDNDEECEVKNMAQPTIFNTPFINAEMFTLKKINESIRPYLETPTATSIY